MPAKKKTVESVQTDSIAQLYKLLDTALGKGRGYQVSKTPIETIPRASTGSLWADWVTGGGVPYGRISEFYGTPGGGKSTLGLSTLAQIQKAGHYVAYIDAEFNFDKRWAEILGLDVGSLFLLRPDTGEEALKAIEAYVTSGAVRGIVVDSVAALIPVAEFKETDIEKASVGRQALMMSKGLRKLVGIIGRSECAVIFINQIREKVAVKFGSPETTSGGKALPFYSSLRLDVRRGPAIKHADIEVGMETKLRCRKNRGGAQSRSGSGRLIFNYGFHPELELLMAAVDIGAVTKSGAYYKFAGDTMGQGQFKAAKWLQEHVEDAKTIRNAVLDVWDKAAEFTI